MISGVLPSTSEIVLKCIGRQTAHLLSWLKSIPLEFTDYRPISLCTCLYRFISKMLANRMKCVMLSASINQLLSRGDLLMKICFLLMNFFFLRSWNLQKGDLLCVWRFTLQFDIVSRASRIYQILRMKGGLPDRFVRWLHWWTFPLCSDSWWSSGLRQ